MAKVSDKFADIRPYNDDEVAASVQRLLNDDAFLSVIAEHNLPKWVASIPLLGQFLVKRTLSKKYGAIDNVAELQTEVAGYLDLLIQRTTRKVTFSGIDKLDKNTPYLFISNHRDIALDPALINWGLYKHDMNTVRIAIGDNLLQVPYMTELMKLNKSFIVKRSAKAPKEMLRTLTTLSHYIYDSLETGNSIWIAQKEGRAKDGNDFTDPALIKMLQLHGRKLKMEFADYVRALKIVPVSISYELEPCEQAKANELYCKQTQGEYQKADGEDIESIIEGFRANKGHVHLAFGDVITDNCDTPDQLATTIDEHIHRSYYLHPTNLLAAEKDLANINDADKTEFANRIASAPSELQSYIRQIYATPVHNSQ